MTVLFQHTIFGPVHSRRLGVSLGVNLLPNDGKVCSFDCIYCEAGYNAQGKGSGLPTREQVKEDLRTRLMDMHAKGEKLDVITFAGNGEPTLHPHFEEIIYDTIELRDLYYPEAKVSVLSNATMIDRPAVARALKKVDNNILKIDSVNQRTVELINAPNAPTFRVDKLLKDLKQFDGDFIVQTMFVRGEHNGWIVDNTTGEEVNAWLEEIARLNPKQVMVYTIDRKTPEEKLQKVSPEELERIAGRVRELGISVTVSA